MLIALAICAVLVASFSFSSEVAYAADESGEEAVVSLIDGETATNFTSFAAAVAAAPSRNSGKTVTIKLLQDCEFCVFSDKSLIIDLNGKILNSGSTNTVTIESSNVTFQDSSETMAGEMTIHGDIDFFKCTVNVLSGTFTNASDNDYTDFCMYMETNANITGGVFNINFMATLYSNTTINGPEGSYDLKFSSVCVITASSVQISNAYIRRFSVYKIMPMLKDNVFIGEMKFYETETDYKGVLFEGCAYYAADGTGYIKPSDMNETTPVYAQKCTHDGSFTVNEQEQYVCDYCGYICTHEKFDTDTHKCAVCGYDCPHESYDTRGVCKACAYVCPHNNVDDSNVCDVCKNTMNVKLTNGQGIKYFIQLENAFAACEGEDKIVILNDMELKSTKTVNQNVTLDLNGKKLWVCTVQFNSKSVVTDSVGGGYMLVSADFLNTSADIELRGKDDTEFRIFKYSIKIKVYGGKITRVIDNRGELSDLLPEGYMFVENGKALLWSEVLEKPADYTGALIVQKCQHTDLDENLVCRNCNHTIPTGEAIDRVSAELATAQNELQDAIDKKADAATINSKIAQLNEAIQNAEKTRKDNDDALNGALSKQIEDAQKTAIDSAQAALDIAKVELNTAINKKADASKVDESIKNLTAAIANAESVNNAYVDENNQALKTELEGKIAQAKDEVTAAIAALSERLEAVENKTNTLQTVLIVFIVLLSLANVATVVIFALRKRK